jgi:hypothetical protein
MPVMSTGRPPNVGGSKLNLAAPAPASTLTGERRLCRLLGSDVNGW